MATAYDVLSGYVDRYLDAIRHVDYALLDQLQGAPLANLAHGAAGSALALERAHACRRYPAGRTRAASWSGRAAGDRRRAAFMADAPAGSILFGRAGAHAVEAIVAGGEARERARRRLVRTIRRASDGKSELANGVAGRLLAALRAGASSRPLTNLADELAADLLGALRRRTRRSWDPRDAHNLAHGWPGSVFAVLCWIEQRRGRAPAWLADASERLATCGDEDAVAPAMRGTWCTGAAGIAMLWAKAFEVTGRTSFRAAARRAARFAIRHQPPTTHLCCGVSGVAYALLSLERIDPGRGWREKAMGIGARAVLTPLKSRWPNGLLWGHPGIVCLALDLLSDEPRGFPLIEG